MAEEESYLFYKTYECPVCRTTFKQPTVKTGKARLVMVEDDLRQVHRDIDVGKYDVVACTKCGYSALNRYFGPLAKPHRDLIQEHMRTAKIKIPEPNQLVISYETAFIRYQQAGIFASFRRAKKSEMALICLRTAWMLRGQQEDMKRNWEENPDKAAELYEQEDYHLKLALEGFLSARAEEQPPVAGMDNVTLDYLLAALLVRFDRDKEATRLLQGIIYDKDVLKAQKDKARLLLEKIKGE